MALKSQQELLEEYVGELQSQAPEVTDAEEGSIVDVLAGVSSVAVSEITRVVVSEVAKTYIDNAEGDDLERLAVDHYGSAFAKPEATKAVTTVTFSRANTDKGDVPISAGTIVKTPQNAAGKSVRFEVVNAVTLTGLSINASVRAMIAGAEGNVLANKITQIETTLIDPSVTVSNSLAASGGEETQNDSQYRETIRQLIQSLSGSTEKAIKAKALTVPGVAYADCVTEVIAVKEWDIGGSTTVGDYFKIPRAKLYVADVNGVASDALIGLVKTAIKATVAAGVLVVVLSAIPQTINWSASFSLNPSGPNYSVLSVDPAMVEDEMLLYLQGLAIGADFDRNLARAAILSKFGPAGTNDLTDFTTNSPTGTVVIAETGKAIPGTVEIV